MTKSAYIHIPFCSEKCYYCSFVSFCNIGKKDEFLSALSTEINSFYEDEQLETLYFGGGTPSVLYPRQIKDIMQKFKLSSQCEITAELNPENLDYDYLSQLYDIGVNRISIGCQSFDDEILKLINRRHNSKKVLESVETACKIGFKNISLDLIYGLPKQTLKNFLKDLEIATSLDIQHISFYGLKIDKGCYFYKNKPLQLPDDDVQADMFVEGVKYVTVRGFEHYEVSNFGKPSKHNLTYWNNEEYYGFGVSAHGYKNGIRYENTSSLEQYLINPTIRKNNHVVTKQEKLEEEIFLGLRKCAGIDIDRINNKYDIDFEKLYENVLSKYLKLNMLKRTPQGYAFTIEGILVSNVILADFLL